MGLSRITIFFCALLVSVGCHAGNIVTGTIAVVDNSGESLPGAANIVVFVEGNDADSTAALGMVDDESSRPHVSHKGQAFSPRVLVITTGTTVDFKNDDRIYHNAFSLSKSKPFDLGIYPVGTSKFVTFEQPGLVRVYCNMHPDMISNILVLANRYFFVTADDGQYSIDDLPDGDFTVRIWSEYANQIERRIVLAGGQTMTEDFEATSRPQFKQHRNKFGKSYRDKY